MNAPTRTTTPPWIIVAKREMMVQLTDKAFWVSTITTIALVALSFVFGGLFGGGSSTTSIAVSTDEAAQVVAVASAEGMGVEALRVADGEAVAAVESGEASAALTHDGAGWQLTIKDLMNAPDLSAAVASFQMDANAAEHGIDMSLLQASTELELVTLEEEEGQGIAVLLATLAFALLFMLSAMTFGMQIANSVVTEKESRIAEILAAAIPTRQLLLGKIVGSTIMALAQVTLIATAALVGLSLSEWSSLAAMMAPVVGWFVLFFLVGFASLACLWAAAGAMATRHQDLTQTTTPLITIVFLVYIAGFVARGGVAEVLSYVPIASTVTMPGRLLSGESNWFDALLAMGAAVAFMALCLWLGSAIYRRALLQTGSVLSWKDALGKRGTD